MGIINGPLPYYYFVVFLSSGSMRENRDKKEESVNTLTLYATMCHFIIDVNWKNHKIRV